MQRANPQQEKLIREYTALAPDYDQRWATYLERSLDLTFAAAHRARAAREPRRTLDVACGTGLLLERVERAFRAADNVGVDAVPAMLAQASERGLSRSTFLLGGATSLPVADNAFDLVLSSNALHYFDDVPAALREMRRAIAPHGSLVITDWCREYLTIKCLDLLLPLTPEAHVRAYTRAELAAALREACFEPAQAHSERIDWFWGLMTVVASPR